MRKVILTFLLIIMSVSHAIAVVPPTFSVNNLYPDAKFIGTAEVLSAKVHKNNENLTCGVAYEAAVTRSAFGAEVGVTIDLHMLIDMRKNEGLEPLEVGSEYFIYAESKDTHKFVNLTDVIHRFPIYPPSCHALDASLYIYREFSGKVITRDGISFVGGWGLQLIKEFKKVKAAHYSEYEYKVVTGSVDSIKKYDQKLHFLGFVIDDLIGFLKMKIFKKSSQ